MAATLTSSVYWDDQTAGEDLIKAIEEDFKFYNEVVKSSNHKNADGKGNISLLAYDGDRIEGYEGGASEVIPNLNAHAYMTTEDLTCTPVAYSRKSLLSAGLTESAWADSINGNIGAIGFTGENGEDYFSNNQTQYNPGN